MLANVFAAGLDDPVTIGLVILCIVLGIILLIGALIFFSFIQLWIQSFLTGAGIGIVDMVRMRLIKIDYSMIARQKIALVQAGVPIKTQDMEAHVLSRGNIMRAVGAVIAAHQGCRDFRRRTDGAP